MSVSVRLDHLEGGLALITINDSERSVNTLSTAVLKDLAKALDELVRMKPRGAIVCSGKPGHFIAGADLRELVLLTKADKIAIDLALDLGRQVIERLAALPFPTVGLIDGVCLGGGLELALALDERIVVDGPRTLLGAPEVKLGLMPAWGGTQRLPRLIGLDVAAKMIVSGEAVNARRAKELGLVSAIAPGDRLLDVGRSRLVQMRARGDWRSRRNFMSQAPTQDPAREAVLLQLERTAAPSPAAALIVKVVREGFRMTLAEGLQRERTAFSAILRTPEAAAGIAAFFDSSRKTKQD